MRLAVVVWSWVQECAFRDYFLGCHLQEQTLGENRKVPHRCTQFIVPRQPDVCGAAQRWAPFFLFVFPGVKLLFFGSFGVGKRSACLVRQPMSRPEHVAP